MRVTAAELFQNFRDDTGNHASTDASLQTYFLSKLAYRYQVAFSEINNKMTQKVFTGSTVAGQQFYHYPPGIFDISDCTITINGLNYPVLANDSNLQWDRINLVLISVTALPQFVFPRKDDFGIWPIPQAAYTINLQVNARDRSITDLADYVAGTVSTTNNSQVITGSGTNFTANMPGYWFVMNDITQPGQGYYYRIASVQSTTQLTLETYYMGASVSGAAYRIGQTPELPEEVHMNLEQGAVADYYGGPRSDMDKFTAWDNMFWTGNAKVAVRDGIVFTGGILGAKTRYAGRQEGAIVWKHGLQTSWTDRMWASGITN